MSTDFTTIGKLYKQAFRVNDITYKWDIMKNSTTTIFLIFFLMASSCIISKKIDGRYIHSTKPAKDNQELILNQMELSHTGFLRCWRDIHF